MSAPVYLNSEMLIYLICPVCAVVVQGLFVSTWCVELPSVPDVELLRFLCSCFRRRFECFSVKGRGEVSTRALWP